MRDSLLTLERLTGFVGIVTTQRNAWKEIRERVKTLSRDGMGARRLLRFAHHPGLPSCVSLDT